MAQTPEEQIPVDYNSDLLVSERDDQYQLQQRQTHEHEIAWPWDPESSEDEDEGHAFSIHRPNQATNGASIFNSRPQAHTSVPTVQGESNACVRSESFWFDHEPSEQLLDKIKNGSPSDKIAALTTLKADFYTLKTFLGCAKGIQELLDMLTLDAPEHDVTSDLVHLNSNPSSEADRVDWKSTAWELLRLILYNLNALSLDIEDIRKVAIVPVLGLVEQEKDARYRSMALRFLLAEPAHCAECQDFIVDSGGISLLVNALAIERDIEASQLMLELLHQVSAAGTSNEQEINLTVQGVVDSDDQRKIEYGNLLLLANQVQVPAFAPSATEADRKEQFGQFVLQTSTNTLYLASASLLHKHIALKCVREALTEFGFAFVFDCEGIPLLWDILMQSEAESVNALAVDILRWLAQEDDAFRDHILEFYSQYTSVQDVDTKLKAASIRCEIFGEQNKRE